MKFKLFLLYSYFKSINKIFYKEMWNNITCNSNYSDFLQLKEVKRYKKSLSNMKPRVNTSGSAKGFHAANRSKQFQLRAKRQEEINQANQNLIGKMVAIANHCFLNFLFHNQSHYAGKKE